MSASDEFDDPFMPGVPTSDDIGRMFSHGHLEPGWICRWCGNHLTATPVANFAVCFRCDLYGVTEL